MSLEAGCLSILRILLLGSNLENPNLAGSELDVANRLPVEFRVCGRGAVQGIFSCNGVAPLDL